MNKNTMKSIILVSALALSLTSCRTTNEDVGTAIGAISGAAVGSAFGKGSGRTIATIAGGVVGGMVGGSLGRDMDARDRTYYDRTYVSSMESLPSGRTAYWKNPDSGNQGSFTPTKTYQRNDGKYCREFTQKIIVGGKSQEAFGVACRMEDGTWKIVQENQ